MTPPGVARRWLIRLAPLAFLLAAFGHLLADPAGLLVDAERPTVDRERVVDAPPGNDLTRLFLPTHRWVADRWRRDGRLPEWDDRGFGGRPLVGNPQAGLFYPPAWLAWLAPAPATLGWITLAHLIWAGLGMIRLGRVVGLSEAGSAVAAGGFAMTPYVLAQAFEGHYPHVWAACWFPWAFAAMLRLGRGECRAGLDLAACLAAVGLVGHVQEGYYLAIALGAWGLVDGAALLRGPAPGRRSVGVAAAWMGAGVLAAGLVAVDLIPAGQAQAWGLRAARLPLRLAGRYHPGPINGLQLLGPGALGGPSDYFGPANYWEAVLSVGLVPLALAVVGAAWAGDRRRARGWIALTALAVLFALGRQGGLFALMYEGFPGMDRFRVPARALFLASLGAAVLAGLGVDALREAADARPDRWRRLGRAWLVAGVVILGAVGWGSGRSGQLGLSPASFGVGAGVLEARRPAARGDLDRAALGLSRLAHEPTFWLAVAGTSAGLALASIRPGRRRSVAVGLGLLGLAELAGSGWGLLRTAPAAAFLDPGAPGRALRAAAPGEATGPPPRVRADEAILPDLAAVGLGLAKTDIDDAFQVQHAADLYGRLFELSRPRPFEPRRAMDEAVAERERRVQRAVLGRMGVEAVAFDRSGPRLRALVESAGWPVAAVVPGRRPGDGDVGIAPIPDRLPRAYVVPRARVEPDSAGAVDRFPAVDPREAVLMPRDPLGDLPSAPRQSFRAAAWVESTPGRAVLEVATEHPGLLVVAETWMPGWSARVDGRPAAVGRGNRGQQAVALRDPGRHRVVLEYRAPGFRAGLAVSLAALGTWAGLRVAGRRINRAA